MAHTLRGFWIAALIVIPHGWLRADEPGAVETQKRIVAAVERSVPLLEKAARSYPTHRKCFACHHQTMPLLGVAEARRSGIKTDEKLPGEILDFTSQSFRGKIADLRAGENIGGKGLTVGYGLWTLHLAEAPVDDLSEAMVAYLLKTQGADGSWELHSIRPPAEESLVMCTFLAVRALKEQTRGGQRDAAEAAIAKAREWIATAKVESQEDRIARLLSGKFFGAPDAEVSAAREAVFAGQREDGGWGQNAEMESDGYATGTTLYVLLDTGLAPGEVHVDRAISYLLKNQDTDGSWFVATRAKPVQVFFDNGDPHGKSQFISIAATGWSTAALARVIRPAK
jgi:N-acyl-D-amino-acid deacylase